MGDKIKCLLLSILYVDFIKNSSAQRRALLLGIVVFLHLEIDLLVTIELLVFKSFFISYSMQKMWQCNGNGEEPPSHGAAMDETDTSQIT